MGGVICCFSLSIYQIIPSLYVFQSKYHTYKTRKNISKSGSYNIYKNEKAKKCKKNICEIILYMCTYYELESRKYFIYTFEFLFFFLSFWKTLLMLFLKYFT